MRSRPTNNGNEHNDSDNNEQLTQQKQKQTSADSSDTWVNHLSQWGEKTITKYKNYVPITIGEVTCRAMVDSGNLFKNVISKDLMLALGLTLADLAPMEDKTTVGTAKKGECLQILGRVKKPLHITLGDNPTKFKTRPVVLDGLAMAFNISGPFLSKHSIDQLHSRGVLRVQGRTINLLDNPRPRGSERVTDKVYVVQDTCVPPSSVAWLSVRSPAAQAGQMATGGAIVQGGVQFMEKTDLHPWLNAITTIQADGTMIVGVMNTQPYDINLTKGTQYGEVTATCAWGEASQHPGKIATLQAEKSGDRTKKEEGPTKADLQRLVDTFRLTESPMLKTSEDIAKAASLLPMTMVAD